MTDPYARTPQGLFDRIFQRIGDLEERLGRLPARLSGGGREVGDWNDAIEPGFYWNPPGSAENWPYASAWQGHVDVGADGRIVQSLTDQLNPAVTWKRSRKAPNTPTSFNGAPVASSAANPRALTEWQQRWSWTRSEQASGGPASGNGRFIRFTCPSSQDSASRGWDIYSNPDGALGYSGWTSDMTLRPCWAGEPIDVEVWVRSSKALNMRITSRIHNGADAWLEALDASAATTPVPANTWTKITRTITPAFTGYMSLQVIAASGVALVSGDTIDGANLSFKYQRGEWTRWRRSDNILVPFRAIGGTSAAPAVKNNLFDMQTGRYNMAVGDKYFALDGIFTDEFRAYEFRAQWHTGANNGAGVRFRQNTVEITASQYAYAVTYNSGGTAAALIGTANQLTFPPVSATGFWMKADILEPTTTSCSANQKRCLSTWGGWSNQQAVVVNSGLGSYDQQYLDGIAIYNSDQGLAGVAAGSDAWITVRGIA